MDQTSREPFILDWGLDIEDQIYFAGSAEVYLAKPEVLTAADLATATSMTSKTSDLFHILSDASDTTSISDHGDQLIAFDSDNEDTQQHTGDVLEDSAKDARERLLAGLENILLSFLDQLGTNAIKLDLVNRLKTKEDGSPARRVLHWPKKAKNGSFKSFARLFRVVDLVHEALITDTPTTKRDIFYKDVPLFKTQSVVDDLVDDLAATLEVSRGDLNIRASPKGLFCGSGLSIHMKRGGIVHGTDSDGALIPPGVDISHVEVSETVSWVLIVEKEAVFQTLCRANLASHPCCPGPGLVITGKGYPDLATRELVSHLSLTLSTSVPLLALVDADAFGLDILSVYKFGSQSLSHERNQTTASRILWLGLWASELSSLSIDRDGLIPLTKHDHKKALLMLKRNDTMMPTQWKKEISYMLHTRRKAEIEIISSTSKIALRPDAPRHSAPQIYFAGDDPIAKHPLVEYLIPKLNLFCAYGQKMERDAEPKVSNEHHNEPL